MQSEYVNEEYAMSELARSYLYHLNPIWDGPYTESLTSYTSRLSDAHGLTMADFLKEVLSSVLHKPYLNDILKKGGTRFFYYSSAFNGLARGAERLVQGLQYLTKVENLQLLTFLPYREVLSHIGLLHRFRAWCPLCYQEWIESNAIIYDPLIWSVQTAEFCSIHRSRLVHICSKCGRNQFHWERYSRPGYCSCGNWLGVSGSISCSNQPSYFINNTDNQMGISRSTRVCTIIQLAQEKQSQQICAQQIISHLLTLTDGNVALLARRVGLPKSTMQGWTQRSRVPLPSLIDLSLKLNLNLHDILLCSAFHDVTAFTTLASPQVFKSSSRISPFRSSDVEILLQTELLGNPPRSLRCVSKAIGVGLTTLRRRFPKLSQQISDRYRDYIQQQSETRFLMISCEIKRCVQVLSKEGIYPSRRQVERFLGRPALLHEFRLQQVWKQEIMKLYSVDKIQIRRNLLSCESKWKLLHSKCSH
ncbi:TniQ family protein [Alicyclobacillus fastidiosus]|uniref:TniQ family protein n=1 Tax=Alicyclobacillus fastidiosus TaxID=392011 RepID=UPI0034DD9E4B